MVLSATRQMAIIPLPVPTMAMLFSDWQAMTHDWQPTHEAMSTAMPHL